MSTDEVIDISGTSNDRRRRQVWLRIGIPVGGVALVIVAILAIVLYSERANRSGVLRLSDDLLTGLQDRISLEVTGYLDPATRAARLARDMVAREPGSDSRPALEAFAASALRQIPQIDAFYSGDANGNFIMVQRGEAGGTVTKLIQNAPGLRLVELIHHDPDGHVTGRELQPNDQFDPRTRDWYRGALKATDLFWTDVYVFFSHRTPGITAAVRLSSADGIDRIFGVDITLKALSEFLASLNIGRSGRAVIIDGSGHLIAAPDASHMLHENNGQLATVRLDQLDDPVLAAAYDRFRVEGYGRRVIDVGGVPIVSIASRLPARNRDWSLLMVVPEADFTGFIASNGRTTLSLSLVVIALASVLAALLVRQGLRADRAGRLLLDRGRAIEQQSRAFADLARQSDLFDRSHTAPIQAVTETLANLASAQRVSVWQWQDDGRRLHCDDAYEVSSAGHVAGLQITRAELPQFFAALESGEEIQTPDAANDRRTTELHRVLMHHFRSRAAHVQPIRSADRTVGALILEDAAKISEAREFVSVVAGMLALRMRDGADVSAGARTEVARTVPVLAGERSSASDLVLKGLDEATLGADVFAATAIMVVKFSDMAAMAARDIDGVTTLADRVAIVLQDIAAEHNIPYMKLVGDDVVAAAGFVPDDADAILRIADAAVAVRERCLELFEAAGRKAFFHIGIDCGVAIGSHVGRQPRVFNLWGGAVRTADMMAATGPGPATIQVTEAAYNRLRQHFLFRLRGNFYLPDTGSEQAFVLGGRQ